MNYVPTRIPTRWRVCMDYRKLNAAARKDHFPRPFIDQMLDKLVGRAYYYFLDGYSGYNQIAIAPEDKEKIIFTCPFGTFAFHYDCLIFEEYLMEGTNHVWEFLREYEECSGQMVNYDKSLIYFSPSVDDVVRKGMVMALGVRMSSNLEKYLGMAIVVGWNKRLAFCHIKEQMEGELMVCVPVAYSKE
ncbi:uncharacterized protein [Gossypium hirsutum]|uniref:RNA-directed DNA polymerase homolog n=1 Tax=Gossypium hirsutum TaxID=3635 RepID=A0A1U8N3I1_GOSHI|nr:uncharacterized protein LOC107944340 [Gossypium hirsutum]